MNKTIFRKLYQQMVTIRSAEEALAAHYPEQEMRCPVHLCVGQEAISAGVCFELTKKDYVLSNHRAHGHYLAKGGSAKKMFAEIYGKSTGCALGRGGSMHLIDLSVNFLGSTPIVGNIIPVATGVAFAEKMRKGKNIAVVFLGDAAVEEGVFGESLNFAVLNNLPIVYICENNLYSVYTHIRARQPKRKLTDIAVGYGAKTYSGDGNNVLEVAQLMKKAVKQIKRGVGPVFIELATYRWLEHCGPNFDNDLGYRTEAEFRRWKKLDPLEKMKKYGVERYKFDIEYFQKIENKIASIMERNIQDAKNDPVPVEDIQIDDVYSVTK